MFLTYGRDERDNLIHISEAERGDACGLFCPFCGGPLTARKGDVVAHHFAHRGDSCRPTSAAADDFIPSYEGYFILGLSKSQRQALHQLIQAHGHKPFYASEVNATTLKSLGYKGFVSIWVQPVDDGGMNFTKAACLTNKARAFAGQLTLADFAAFIQSEFERSLARLRTGKDDSARIALQLLNLEIERIRQTYLYFLEIETALGPIHKIGITVRPIEERISEIQSFLKPHLATRSIRPLFCLPGMAYVEAYFKAKYSTRRLVTLGSATEYFKFEEGVEAVQAELTHLVGAIETGFQSPQPVTVDPERPRLRAVFVRPAREWNKFKSWWDSKLLFGDIVNVATGERVADWQLFTQGKTFEALGLEEGDLIEFNAAFEGKQLKRPTKVVKLEVR
jgi:hypothetical protein